MTRARTKVAEWWETEFDRGFVERGHASFTPRRGQKAAHTIARISGGKVYRVTRYRLAPMVKLVWRVDVEHPNELDARTEEDRFGISSALATVRDDGTYDVWVAGAVPTARRESKNAAKDACAARMRELGYRVVDP